MNEAEFLRILKKDPDNEEARLAYFKWLANVGHDRAEYVRWMRERAELQEKLADIDSHLETYMRRGDEDWLDVVFPLRVRSPTVGRCYLNPTPDKAPFVAVGTQVAPDTVVCLIEAMMIFNEITADVHGVVAEIAVENGDFVEFNQILFRLNRPPRPIAGG